MINYNALILFAYFKGKCIKMCATKIYCLLFLKNKRVLVSSILVLITRKVLYKCLVNLKI